MTKLFTAKTADILNWLLKAAVVVLKLLLFLFGLVLGVLAAWLVFAVLAAAPPDLTTPLTAMHSATPVEVLLLNVVLAAVLAHLRCHIKLALALLKLLNAILHLFSFSDQVLLFLLEVDLRLMNLVELLSLVFHVAVLLHHHFLECLHLCRFLLLESRFFLDKLVSVLAIIVSICSRLSDIGLEHLVLGALLMNLILQRLDFQVVLVFEILGI